MKQFGIVMDLDKKNVFEGWFTKVDDVNDDLMISVIWGYSTFEGDEHSFIQFTNSLNHKTKYIRYDMNEIKYEENPFKVTIGKNYLTKNKMHLDINFEDLKVFGDFKFSEFQEIKKSLLKPNIMGFLSFFPNECNHSITSMHHFINGFVNINDNEFNIQNANGYIEKDWGTSFPQKYVWAQANDKSKNSVVFSYATVPMLGKYAKGFFLVFHIDNKEYRFSTIEGSKLVSFENDDKSFKAVIKKKNLELEIYSRQYNPVDLRSPNQGQMRNLIKESLDGEMKVILKDKNKVIKEFSSNRASIDIHFN